MNSTEVKDLKTQRRPNDKRRLRPSSVQAKYSSYINKILKNADTNMTISSKAMSIMNSFVMDNFNRICEEASMLCKRSKTKTMTAREIQTAVRLVYPGDLARMASNEGTKAVNSYTSKSKKNLKRSKLN